MRYLFSESSWQDRCMSLQLLSALTDQKSEGSKLSMELTDLQKSNLDLQRRHVQFQHELRRRDKEFERLQAGPDQDKKNMCFQSLGGCKDVHMDSLLLSSMDLRSLASFYFLSN